VASNISLKQLKAFLAVAESGSFTEGARRLNVTQSALSLLVKNLEGEVGFRLLDRTTRRVEVSGTGREFQVLARKVIDDLQSVVRGAAEVATVQRGVARVGATEALACTLIAPAMAAYQQVKPTVEVRLVETTIHTMLAALKNGEVDYIIGPTSLEEAGPGHGIRADPLFASSFAALCPRNHSLANLQSVRWGELVRYPLIAHVSSWMDRQLRDGIEAERSKHGCEALPDTRLVSNMVTGLSLAAVGLGVMVAPQYLSSLAKDLGLSAFVPIRPTIRRVISVYSRQSHALSPAAEHFLTFCKGYIQQKGLSL
jgi:DNA-binding transcriptional LysR family regulator